jgi:hypothetical protein
MVEISPFGKNLLQKLVPGVTKLRTQIYILFLPQIVKKNNYLSSAFKIFFINFSPKKNLATTTKNRRRRHCQLTLSKWQTGMETMPPTPRAVQIPGVDVMITIFCDF